MTITSTTLRPGLLVGMKTAVSGNVEYNKTDIVEDHVNEAGERLATWQTDKVIADAAEYEAAIKVRTKARGLITAVCARSDFGLLCPESKQGELETAIRKAREVCVDFNLTARITEVSFYAITGRIAADDVAAVRAINSEVRALLDDMSEGIKKLDVKSVRDAADKAKKLGQMLSPEAQARIQEAILAARDVATKIKAAGETAAIEIDVTTLATLAQARTAFLDLDGDTELVDPDAAGRAIDLDPSVEVAAPEAAQPDLDIEDLM